MVKEFRLLEHLSQYLSCSRPRRPCSDKVLLFSKPVPDLSPLVLRDNSVARMHPWN